MALKFLNKKGWHTGSLRNIENVWKAEQKHEAEQKKLEELRKQIHEERERAEFRQLQVEAGLIPRQERLDFLYESGLAVGKGGSSFKALESLPKSEPEAAASSSTSAKQQQSGVPGALFEEKPQTANDSWRKLHSDPLLMIRQREQEALARVKNNPIQMAMIRKSVEAKKDKGKDKDEKKHRKKHRTKKSKHQKHLSSENDSDSEDPSLTVEKHRDGHHKGSKSDKSKHKKSRDSDEELGEGDSPRKKYYEKEYKDRKPSSTPNPKYDESDHQHQSKKRSRDSQRREYSSEHQVESRDDKRSRFNSSDKPPRNEPNNWHYDSQSREYSSERRADSLDDKRSHLNSFEKPPRNEPNNRHYDTQRKEYSSEHSRDDNRSHFNSSDKPPRNEPNNRHRNSGKISEEERAARLREMQMDAERHEEQRWKRLKKAADSDAEEAVRDRANLGRNFLDATQKSVYGAEKGGSSTIEESVRRRTHYLQRRSTGDSNAFRRS